MRPSWQLRRKEDIAEIVDLIERREAARGVPTVQDAELWRALAYHWRRRE